MNTTLKPKVFVAMSGGVDSSVVAAILKNRGYETSGIFLNLGQINYKNALNAAKKVAKKIGIPQKTIDLRKKFKKEVIDYFLKGYSCGITPNPCIICNKKIKFRVVFDLMKKWKYDYLSTGHYVKKIKGISGFELRVARDKNKDQSYFLYNLTQKQLAKLLFPLGNYTKDEVKKMAKKWRLKTLKRESHDICFLAGEHGKFLRRHLKKIKRGEVMDINGNLIGFHDGLPFYTIGQRIGLGGGKIVPYYVVEKDAKRNILIIASKAEEKKFYKKEVVIKNINWISGKSPDLKKVYKARIRYRQPLQTCRIILLKTKNKKVATWKRSHLSGNILAKFAKPQRAVTPGQSLVLYDGQKLLGGGIIK
ncbi:MAG: tRNA 2-thiouridine(34) synthase MnmA [Patescibacteria group bacterium]